MKIILCGQFLATYHSRLHRKMEMQAAGAAMPPAGTTPAATSTTPAATLASVVPLVTPPVAQPVTQVSEPPAPQLVWMSQEDVVDHGG